MTKLKEIREARGLSQEQVAEMAGTSQPQIYKLEKGLRSMTLDWAAKLARVLDVPVANLLEDADKGDHISAALERFVRGHEGSFRAVSAKRLSDEPHQAQQRSSATMPVYAETWRGLAEEPIDEIARPVNLATARDPYALQVTSETMMPRFRPGQILHVAPKKPPVPGAGVVVQMQGGEMRLAEFVRRTGDGFTLREYHPEPREFQVFQTELDGNLHTVVGLTEPF
ncbi:helix-turn-helix domain-containing protein [Azospirillum formosense]|uniref:Helix-turn-helix domain-containing protein n=1 Tax=Azospirillum formosense TaxID=861533 RepID=A0ABX2KRH4_9PROT|nr:helix-turn-helix domain-containing protein [Azospirillum formosense]MBY3756743.1 helix-turn-helix domain-containing protein [Azospirillum formosense]NUB19206.1 helix-turn-helix domain-containing protein [Azospirillum formosense]